MTPSPLLPSPQSKQEETAGEFSSEDSSTSRLDSSVHSRVDEFDAFDPDSVDFEPLLVSGSEFGCTRFFPLVYSLSFYE